MTSGGSSPQGVPKACKKAGFAPTGAVCRSCTLHARLHQGSPHPEGKPFRFSRLSSIRRRHLAGRVPRAKRLGRSERSEIPVQEICTWREIQEIRVFLLDRTRIFGYIVSVIFKFIVIR